MSLFCRLFGCRRYRIIRTYRGFVALTVRDHCDPFKVYKAMAEIDEFISYMAVDV